jgi:hypothetical protein
MCFFTAASWFDTFLLLDGALLFFAARNFGSKHFRIFSPFDSPRSTNKIYAHRTCPSRKEDKKAGRKEAIEHLFWFGAFGGQKVRQNLAAVRAKFFAFRLCFQKRIEFLRPDFFAADYSIAYID